MATSSGYRSFHVTLSIKGCLKLPDKTLNGMIKINGIPATADHIRQVLREYQAKGFEVLPVCDNHDEKGHCLGHDKSDDLAELGADGQSGETSGDGACQDR